jgi:hypothetical protein
MLKSQLRRVKFSNKLLLKVEELEELLFLLIVNRNNINKDPDQRAKIQGRINTNSSLRVHDSKILKEA